MNKIIETETERLLLRQWQQADKTSFAQINADKRIMAFFPRQLSKTESDVWVENAQFHIATQGWGFWAVETKQQHQLIGFVGLQRPSPSILKLFALKR
ncbi:MAG: GNAT family N-acetyltransferase [Pseudomonadota bacterium]|nr:GNAT family N-acetyltransferase [Pseudomonadota bacterium]